MLKQTITYKAYDGKEYTDDFYFNLNDAELAERNLLAGEQGLESQLKLIIESKDAALIVSTFKEMIKSSYGVRSLDGKGFEKTEEHWLKFISSPAYSVFFMSIISDAGAASRFVNGIVPADLSDQAAAARDQSAAASSAESLSRSEEARRRSEASLKGHKSAKPKSDIVEAEPLRRRSFTPVGEVSNFPDTSGEIPSMTPEEQEVPDISGYEQNAWQNASPQPIAYVEQETIEQGSTTENNEPFESFEQETPEARELREFREYKARQAEVNVREPRPQDYLEG